MPPPALSAIAFRQGLGPQAQAPRWRAGLLTALAHVILIALIVDIYSDHNFVAPPPLTMVQLKDEKPPAIPLVPAPKLARAHRIVVPPPEVIIAPEDGNNLTMVGGPVAYALGDATYRAQIEAHLARFKQAPPGTGTVYVQMIWDSVGHVLFSHVARSSGSPTLDQAALDMIQKADPLPAIPASIKAERMYLMFPISFK